jgi:hypothetical protein
MVSWFRRLGSTELSYVIPTDGTYAVAIIVLGGSGNALMDVGCSRP